MLTTLQTIPDYSRITVYKTVLQQALVSPQNFTSGTTVQDFTIFGIPPNWVVCGVRIQPLIAFVGVSISSVTVQIGTATAHNVFAAAYELTQTVTNTAFQISSALAQTSIVADNIIARFISTGASINAISAGKVELTVECRQM